MYWLLDQLITCEYVMLKYNNNTFKGIEQKNIYEEFKVYCDYSTSHFSSNQQLRYFLLSLHITIKNLINRSC